MADMMHQTILDEASYAAAIELARLQGGTVEACVGRAVRSVLAAEREAAGRRAEAGNSAEAREERNRRARAWLARWHEILSDPPPLSDHSWLYDDETGLPV